MTSITIGKNVTSIDDFAFKGISDKIVFYCYATTPPTLTMDSFDFKLKYSDDAKLYVPQRCGSVYKSSYWSNYFKNIIEME